MTAMISVDKMRPLTSGFPFDTGMQTEGKDAGRLVVIKGSASIDIRGEELSKPGSCSVGWRTAEITEHAPELHAGAAGELLLLLALSTLHSRLKDVPKCF